MNPVKALWGLLFRLFPCPTRTGLRRIGDPGRDSPLLLTCSFHNTVGRLTRKLRGKDVWLLVADSKGVNVWCAAGAEEFNTRSVIAALKISGIEELVDHRRLVLPPLGAPGIKAREVAEQTGWQVQWGPVRMRDIPRYLEAGGRRDEPMKRATFGWSERLDAGLGSLFPFYLAGGIGFAVFAGHLLVDYLWVAAGAFLVFMLGCPWIPGKAGWVKVVFLWLPLAAALVLSEVLLDYNPARPHLIIGMAALLVFGSELGGLASTLPSEFDPMMARLGVKKLGNTYFAGTVRAELLAGMRELTIERERCVACGSCAEICPQGVWELDQERRAVPVGLRRCTACRACLVQCQGEAIKADRRPPRTA